MNEPAFHGGCLCGQTRYALAQAPTALNDCHCIDCRRSSGAPYVSWGSVNRRDCSVERGKVRVVHHANRVRSFAECCGTQLFFQETPEAEEIDVTLGSLDEPQRFVPEKAIWIEDHLPWVPLQPGRPVFMQSSRLPHVGG